MKKITSLFIGVFLLSWLPSIASTAEITYYHTDALGTPMAMTDSTGKVVWRGDYYPFGEEYLIEQTPVKNKRHFTGKEKDEESGLHYFGARYMDEASGRFISPDPVTFVNPETSETNTAFLENPLRLNRYVYGLNNPYRYIDPDGNFPETVWDAANLAIGVASFSANVAVGNVAGAAVDAVGIAIDAAATATPFVPGGAGTAIRAARVAEGGADLAKLGRRGKQAKLRQLAGDSNVSSSDRGWIQQEINSIGRGQRSNIRVPPGKNLAHQRGFEAKKGFGYEFSNLQDTDIHKLQHKHEGY